MPSARAEERDTRAVHQAPPLIAFALAAFSGVMIFLPPEGRIGIPLHDFLALLLGRATFILPVALVVAGVVLVIRAVRPSTPMPRRRLAGVGLIALGVLPGEQLLSGADHENTGLVARWLSGWLLDLLGGPGTLVVLTAVLGLGVLLAFDVRLLRAESQA